MDIPTIPGAVYSVVAPTACTITDKATGRVLATTAPNEQKDFRAFGSLTTLSDPSAIYVAASTFSAAPTIGSGSGGGATIQFDTKPTSGSTAAVTSGGLYNILYDREVVLGVDSNAGAYENLVCIGWGATCQWHYTVAVGPGSKAKGNGAVALGNQANADNGVSIGSQSQCVAGSVALGGSVKAKDQGASVIGAMYNNVQTLLYLIGAGTPLATAYEDGEACLGFVVKDSSGNILDCGTRKLKELMTNNTAFAPAAMDLEADPPTPFLPTGSTDPIEHPENLTE